MTHANTIFTQRKKAKSAGWFAQGSVHGGRPARDGLAFIHLGLGCPSDRPSRVAETLQPNDSRCCRCSLPFRRAGWNPKIGCLLFSPSTR